MVFGLFLNKKLKSKIFAFTLWIVGSWHNTLFVVFSRMMVLNGVLPANLCNPYFLIIFLQSISTYEIYHDNASTLTFKLYYVFSNRLRILRHNVIDVIRAEI